MRALVIGYTQKIGDLIAKVFVGLVALWIVFALSFQVYMIYLEFSGKTETIKALVDWFEVTSE